MSNNDNSNLSKDECRFRELCFHHQSGFNRVKGFNKNFQLTIIQFFRYDLVGGYVPSGISTTVMIFFLDL